MDCERIRRRNRHVLPGKKMKNERDANIRIADIHTHILPGVDDGAKTMEDTLEMLRIAAEEGITDVVLTPHYQSGRFFTPAERIWEGISELEQLLYEHQLPIRLHAGTEIYYRSGLEERLEDGSLATMNESEFVLVEFSPMEEFVSMRNGLEDILGLGYTPILAHVERYQCMVQDYHRVEELVDMGCRIQMNAGTISGETGFRMKQFAKKLLKLQLVDYVGTDAHNTAGRAPRMRKCVEALLRQYDRQYVEDILYGNAKRDCIIGSKKI